MKTNVFIVGFMKAGTTALAEFFSQNPEFCVSIPKESGYFASDKMQESDEFHGAPTYFKTRTPSDYEELYKHSVGQEKYRVDASTAYIYSEDAAKNIKNYNPDAKIIIMLREPSSFVHALHMQYINETVEDAEGLDKALDLEDNRKKGKNIPPRVRVPSYLHYSERTKFYDQVKKYFDIFKKENILILTFDELKSNNELTYNKAINFLGADTTFTPDFKLVNYAKKPRNKFVHSLINEPVFKNFLYKVMGGQNYTKFHKKITPALMKKSDRIPLSDETKNQIRDNSKPQIEKLSKLVDIDLIDLWGMK